MALADKQWAYRFLHWAFISSLDWDMENSCRLRQRCGRGLCGFQEGLWQCFTRDLIKKTWNKFWHYRRFSRMVKKLLEWKNAIHRVKRSCIRSATCYSWYTIYHKDRHWVRPFSLYLPMTCHLLYVRGPCLCTLMTPLYSVLDNLRT